VARLDELEALLREGMQRSRQTSLERRAPAFAAIPSLAKARAGLRGFVRAHADDARAWRLLSLAEETLLAYPLAIAALDRALALDGRRDKRDLKRLAALHAAEVPDDDA
jgi:cytochrome c-type biogenesis protein CcmH/NrfG